MEKLQALMALMWMMLSDLRNSSLLFLLLVACIVDTRSLKIPNWLTFGGAALALFFSAMAPFSSGHGLLWALGGLGLGLLVMLPPYVLGVMGAGDVKLMAMVGAFLGLAPTLQAVLFVFICGGILALGHVFLRGALQQLAINLKQITQGALLSVRGGTRPHAQVAPAQSVGKMPYALSIALGTTAFLVAQQLDYVR